MRVELEPKSYFCFLSRETDKQNVMKLHPQNAIHAQSLGSSHCWWAHLSPPVQAKPPLKQHRSLCQGRVESSSTSVWRACGGPQPLAREGLWKGKNQPRGLKYINWIQARHDLQFLLAKVCDRCCFPVLNAIILETLESQVQLGINGATTEKTYPTCQKDDAGSKIILAISTNRMCVGYVKFAFGWVIAPRDGF